MIWVDGRIVPDDSLAISVLDRTFEHGLGLFETLRTWGGRPTLLDEHKARMRRSADELKIPVDPASLPDADDVSRLLDAEGVPGDRMLRITASGGTASGKSAVWMRSSPLPMESRPGGAILCVNAWSVLESPASVSGRAGLALPMTHDRPGKPCPTGRSDPRMAGGGDLPPDDFTARHKTLNYWFKRVAFEQARDRGYEETLIRADPWGYTEGSRSNFFVVIDNDLMTISTDAPIVPGIMRGLILDVASETLLRLREVRTLTLDRLRSADEFFLANAVRGIIPVARIDTMGESIERPSPGPWTAKLRGLIARRLRPDRGTTP